MHETAQNGSDSKLTRVLIVGAGGIGCELVKNLCKNNQVQISILDYDTVSETNLNRQFCYSRQTLGMTKVQCLKHFFMGLNPGLTITTYHGNLYDYAPMFFSRFGVIISALDSAQARNHLNKMAIMNDIVTIDAGTSGFNGQAQAYMRFQSECRFCQASPSQAEQDMTVCSLRNQPSRNIHCIHFALNLFRILHEAADMDEINTRFPTEGSENSGVAGSVYNWVFGHGLPEIVGIATLSDRVLVEPAFPKIECLQSTWNFQKLVKTCLFLFDKFLNQQLRRGDSQRNITPYDKDDDEHATFVFCVTNLRILNFINTPKAHLSFMSFYECKDLSGRIIPAIASTNSIAASLQILYYHKYCQHPDQILPYTSIKGCHPDHKIECLIPRKPSPGCEVCSPLYLYFVIELEIGKVTFGELEQFLAEAVDGDLSERDMRCKQFIVIRNGQNPRPWTKNKGKFIGFNPRLLQVSDNSIKYLVIDYLRQPNYPKSYQFVVVDNPHPIKIVKRPTHYQYELLQSTKHQLQSPFEQSNYPISALQIEQLSIE